MIRHPRQADRAPPRRVALVDRPDVYWVHMLPVGATIRSPSALQMAIPSCPHLRVKRRSKLYPRSYHLAGRGLRVVYAVSAIPLLTSSVLSEPLSLALDIVVKVHSRRRNVHKALEDPITRVWS